MRRRLGIGVVLAITLIGGGLWAHAQSPRVLPSPRVAPVPGQEPSTVLAGNDIGFRVDNWQGDTPVGKLVVRHDGKWVEIKIPVEVTRLTAK
jgi:hypothetical protein